MNRYFLASLIVLSALPRMSHAKSCFLAKSEITVFGADGKVAAGKKGRYGIHVQFAQAGITIDNGVQVSLNEAGKATASTRVCSRVSEDAPIQTDAFTMQFWPSDGGTSVVRSKSGVDWSLPQQEEPVLDFIKDWSPIFQAYKFLAPESIVPDNEFMYITEGTIKVTFDTLPKEQPKAEPKVDPTLPQAAQAHEQRVLEEPEEYQEGYQDTQVCEQLEESSESEEPQVCQEAQ